ncbi:MAG TPA: hypothetical protein P5291_06465, partial [Flavobacteriales bacterium]|nr:hypothetical protein [Flavobacteriales bacterium]
PLHLDLGLSAVFAARHWAEPDTWLRLTHELGYPWLEFSGDALDPFFSGDGFQAVLRAVQSQPKRYKVYEKSGKLKITVAAVKNLGEAKRALEIVVGVKESV